MRTVIANLADWQIAYLAGLVDGEGSLECQKQTQPGAANPAYRVRLSFCFATKEPLATVSEWLGLKVKTYETKQENRSPRHLMHVTKGLAIPLIRRMLPYLILKRRQGELLLAIEEARARYSPTRRQAFGIGRRMPQEAVIVMDALFSQLRGLKSHKRGIRQREMPVRLL